MIRLRLAAVAALGLLVTCDRSDRFTGPSAAISDGTHLGGNRNFFFLPPLVPNPSGSAGYDPDGFDPAARPTVEICLLAGADCAGTQPAGFPLVYTMATGPEPETVRLVESAQHFAVNWHAGDFPLDPASHYRILVLVGGAPLGYADVDVVSSGRELRNVNTNEYIGLVDGRTLPIKFRIERGAVLSIAVSEVIAVHDHTGVLPPVAVVVGEDITVSDQPAVLAPVSIAVTEPVAVSDRPVVLPPIQVAISEAVTVADRPGVLPPVSISIYESITVTDVSHVTPN